jgi:glycosyltransferase involved in cell wall biosynthesis
MPASTTHLVLIPAFNAGNRLVTTLLSALEEWSPVWVVDDGSTDGSVDAALRLAERDPRVRVLVRPRNGGKGAAIETGLAAALASGFTHVLTLDADGQHPSHQIGPFMEASAARPESLVLGRPVFGPEAPRVRLHGRKLSVWLAWAEILGPGIDDPLFGFRVYPADALRRALAETRFARGFDFDPEVAVRMAWRGVPLLNLAAPCRYLAPEDGGVSHFKYVRDNVRLCSLHVRLLTQLFLWRWIAVWRARGARRGGLSR